MDREKSKADHEFTFHPDWFRTLPNPTDQKCMPPRPECSWNRRIYLHGIYKVTEANDNRIKLKRTSSCTGRFERQSEHLQLGIERLSRCSTHSTLPSEFTLSTINSRTPPESDVDKEYANMFANCSAEVRQHLDRIPTVLSLRRPCSAILLDNSLDSKRQSSEAKKIFIEKPPGTCSMIEWPTPVPFHHVTAYHGMPSTFDAFTIFKYRLNYPHLFNMIYRSYISPKNEVTNSTLIEELPHHTQLFIQHVIQRLVVKGNNEWTSLDSTARQAYFKSLLWKRRYYTLLNAVDFVCKDNRILTHVSRHGLFDCVPNVPVLSKGAILKQCCSFSINAESDVPGSNPVGQLFDRITRILMAFDNGEYAWPCMFKVSVGFLSDVAAQSRLLRADLDKQQVVLSRMVHVLKQAKYQKVKLKTHLLRQRQLFNTLTSNLAALRQRLYLNSPAFEQPHSIEEYPNGSVNSPIVDCDNVDGDRTLANGALLYVQQLTELRSEINLLELVLKEEESRRKRLHNRIQELTGNIRVFCRLRPKDCVNRRTVDYDANDNYLRVSSNDKLLFCSDALKEQLVIQNRLPAPTNTSSRYVGTLSSELGLNRSTPCPPKCFIFDRVFDTNALQEDIYREVDDLVTSCLDGYNVCIMAYGQTGSGKTYTMMGTMDSPGVNRRIVHNLFEKCNKRGSWKYSIAVSVLEIYQEDVYDLLREDFHGDIGNSPTPTEQPTRRTKVSQSRQRPTVPWNSYAFRPNTANRAMASSRAVRRRNSVKILSDNLDGVVLKNLTECQVRNSQELLGYLELAERQRHVGKTKLNISSSRSHLIIMLKVFGENQLHVSTTSGTLTLTDLAGSENVNKSGSTGERFFEAACINKSLSSLGRVFDALRKQQKPTYRETKLTYLLRPTLSGDSKCLLFVTLRTEPEHAEETWRAIHFGQGAIQVIPGGLDSKKVVRTCTKHPGGTNLIPYEEFRTSASTIFRCVTPTVKSRRTIFTGLKHKRLSHTTARTDTMLSSRRRWI